MPKSHSPEEASNTAPSAPSKVPVLSQPQPQLRDSCCACALSKVKCNKIKPVCGRCAQRGTLCKYVATKRAGRKRASTNTSDTLGDTTKTASPQSSDPNSQLHSRSQPLSQPQTQPRSSPGFHEDGYLMSPGRSRLSPTTSQQMSVYADKLPNIISTSPTTTDLPMPSSSLMTPSTADLEEFFASLAAFPDLESSDYDILSQPHGFSADMENGLLDPFAVTSFQLLDNIDKPVSKPPLFRPSSPESPSESRASTFSETHSYQSMQSLHNFPILEGYQSSRSDSPSCCLLPALSLLGQVLPNISTASKITTTQSIIAENERSIEMVCDMFKCSCSEDDYLLFILSLIVFKVLDCYMAAAKRRDANELNPRSKKSQFDNEQMLSVLPGQVVQSLENSGAYHTVCEDQDRIAAQLVLGELHRVQRVINIFSQRLKSHQARKSTGIATSPGNTTERLGKRASDAENLSSPFSIAMLDQLETDLRTRLRRLSLEIIETLRHD